MKALFIGFGNVGRTIAKILSTEKDLFPGMSRLAGLMPIGIITRSRGSVVDPCGIDFSLALENFGREGSFSEGIPGFTRISGEEASSVLDYDVLVELSTLSIENEGEPATTHIRNALAGGRHAVSANKGPVSFSYRELSELAIKAGKKFLFETTVMDGAPVLNLCRSCLEGCTIGSVDGIFNSTTNYILTRMEEGADFDDAVREAQVAGVAEADPRNDIDGWDAAAKVSVLANVVLGGNITPLDVERKGISGVSRREVERASLSGRKLKLVCRAWKEGGKVFGKVGVEEIPRDHPFSLVSGGGAVIRIHTDLMGPVLVTQEKPGLYDTAYGVLNDLLSLSVSSP
ncbi:MAG TPA: homoserine dehydrogenase [Thermovirgaceae bacterium]|jgi:homoserine dehydrogenase|nr:homoserine dehydrogenase [Thermovirgaceae bacterium]